MSLVVILLKNIVYVALSAVQFAMLARAILSWFPDMGGKLVDVLYAITEPFIYPVRRLFERMGWFQGLPIDISFSVTFLLITIVMFILP